MDEHVMRDLKLAFGCDLYETIKAARKNREEHAFRHTMAEEGGKMVFAAVFPKKDLLEFPGLDDAFRAKLKTFNLLGVVTDGRSGLDVFHLAGMNKPFTSAEDGRAVARVLDDEPLAAFLQVYFRIKGVPIDLAAVTHEAFLRAVEGEVFKNTSFARMQEADELLRTLEA